MEYRYFGPGGLAQMMEDEPNREEEREMTTEVKGDKVTISIAKEFTSETIRKDTTSKANKVAQPKGERKDEKK